jgi:hypothetical protein
MAPRSSVWRLPPNVLTRFEKYTGNEYRSIAPGSARTCPVTPASDTWRWTNQINSTVAASVASVDAITAPSGVIPRKARTTRMARRTIGCANCSATTAQPMR